MLAVTLSMLLLVSLLCCSFLTLAAANAARTRHVERSAQALAAAEAGVEAALDRFAREAGEAPDQESLELAPGRRATITATREGSKLTILSHGEAEEAGWRLVERTVQVTCERRAGRWRGGSWQPRYPPDARPSQQPAGGGCDVTP